jgi:hypothetical protein
MVSHNHDGKKEPAAKDRVGMIYDGENFLLIHGRSETIGQATEEGRLIRQDSSARGRFPSSGRLIGGGSEDAAG